MAGDYHNAKQIDEEITAETAERLNQRIRAEEERVRDEYQQQFNDKIKGKKKYRFIRYGSYNTFTYNADSSVIAVKFVSPYIIYADKYMSFDKVKEKFYALHGKEYYDNYMKTRGDWLDCETEDCNSIDLWLNDRSKTDNRYISTRIVIIE